MNIKKNKLVQELKACNFKLCHKNVIDLIHCVATQKNQYFKASAYPVLIKTRTKYDKSFVYILVGQNRHPWDIGDFFTFQDKNKEFSHLFDLIDLWFFVDDLSVDDN